MMSPSRHAHLFAATRRRTPRASWDAEGLLRALGASSAFTDDVLGDLREERARRAREDGTFAAHWWYLREAIRSAPHLAWNAVRHGGARGRARVVALVAGLACIPALMLLIPLAMDGPPVRLDVEAQGGRDLSDGIVVNTRHPVRLLVHALDARGNVLRRPDLHYRWLSGTPLSVSRNGIVTCPHRGDSEVLASLGRLSAVVRLRCDPVIAVWSTGSLDLVAGGAPRELTFRGIGPSGEWVSRLTGEITVEDSSVATLRGNSLIPLAPGRTQITFRIGDAVDRSNVDVYEPVATLTGLRSDQRYVAARVHLAAGDTIRWPLPTTGLLWLSYRPAAGSRAMPATAVFGRVRCAEELNAGLERTPCVARAPGAFVRLVNPATRGAPIEGMLLLEHDIEN